MSTPKMTTNKPPPCRCERRSFPHRRNHKCEEYENEGDDIQAELEDDRFNAEFRKVFS